eukprot:TRINITY_DN103073_c0_g1_i1.p1 TRINITY_DN103073_c0_g1~~TRINITY_DN103073_c0_g1_i1.p1  ORF type:complete len:317 (+),score=37.75 TRINITY_DN103073_c0_g1_i1:299-1249(+)
MAMQTSYTQLEAIQAPDVILNLDSRKKHMVSSPAAPSHPAGVPVLDDLKSGEMDVYSDDDDFSNSDTDEEYEEDDEEVVEEDDTNDPTFGITLHKRTGNNRSLAPPDELRYGEEAEEEMHRLDRVIDALEDENEELERILIESKELIRQNATHHFKQRIEEQSRSKAVGDMLSKRTGPQFLLPLDPEGINSDFIDDYSRKGIAQCESRLLKKFTPSNLSLRSSESMSYKNFNVGNSANGRPSKAAKKLREHLQNSASHTSVMQTIKGKVDLKAMLREQMEDDARNRESADAYKKMMEEYSEMQKRIIIQLTAPLPK